MVFKGTYNIRFFEGHREPTSLVSTGTGVELTGFRPEDVTQRWIIEPVSTIIPNAYTIKSVSSSTFIYASVAGKSLLLRPEKYVWFFEKAEDQITIFTDDKNMDLKFWGKGDTIWTLEISGDASWHFEIHPIA